jgi:hypothetical protein
MTAVYRLEDNVTRFIVDGTTSCNMFLTRFESNLGLFLVEVTEWSPSAK